MGVADAFFFRAPIIGWSGMSDPILVGLGAGLSAGGPSGGRSGRHSSGRPVRRLWTPDSVAESAPRGDWQPPRDEC